MQPDFHDNIRLTIQKIPIAEFNFSSNNARHHTERQIQMLVASIKEFGMVTPILLDVSNLLIAGEARVRAATLSGLRAVPATYLNHLSAPQIRALRIAENRLAEKAEWNKELLATELKYLASFDLESKSWCWSKAVAGLSRTASRPPRTNSASITTKAVPRPWLALSCLVCHVGLRHDVHHPSSGQCRAAQKNAAAPSEETSLLIR